MAQWTNNGYTTDVVCTSDWATITAGQPVYYDGTSYTIGYTYGPAEAGHIAPEQPNLPKEVEMKGLYEVIRCYGEDRNNIQVKRFAEVVADGEEDAKIKSGVYGTIDKSWDADFLTIIVRKLGDVKIKTKPQEVKSV
jgi:hypothetical protein